MDGKYTGEDGESMIQNPFGGGPFGNGPSGGNPMNGENPFEDFLKKIKEEGERLQNEDQKRKKREKKRKKKRSSRSRNASTPMAIQ